MLAAEIHSRKREVQGRQERLPALSALASFSQARGCEDPLHPQSLVRNDRS